MKEVWKDVVGYEGLFQISNLGRFFSKRSGKVLKQHLAKSGYQLVSTKIGGRTGVNKCFKIHREVANCFLKEPTEEQKLWADDSYHGVNHVNHIDGCKSNNNCNNLEWCTSLENNLHYLEKLKGKDKVNKIRHPDTKLNGEQVREIRVLVNKGYSERKLAKIYGVSRSSISNAKNGYKWVR